MHLNMKTTNVGAINWYIFVCFINFFAKNRIARSQSGPTAVRRTFLWPFLSSQLPVPGGSNVSDEPKSGFTAPGLSVGVN